MPPETSGTPPNGASQSSHRIIVRSSYTRAVTTYDDYKKAELAEREAWDKVKDALPGTPNHSPELWMKWRERVADLQRFSQDGDSPGKPD